MSNNSFPLSFKISCFLYFIQTKVGLLVKTTISWTATCKATTFFFVKLAWLHGFSDKAQLWQGKIMRENRKKWWRYGSWFFLKSTFNFISIISRLTEKIHFSPSESQSPSYPLKLKFESSSESEQHSETKNLKHLLCILAQN